jgi:hypothetical protein
MVYSRTRIRIPDLTSARLDFLEEKSSLTIPSPGFPVELVGVEELNAAFLK